MIRHNYDIIDWISQFNKPWFLWFVLTLQSKGQNEYGELKKGNPDLISNLWKTRRKKKSQN